jgi:hypothetical protein
MAVSLPPVALSDVPYIYEIVHYFIQLHNCPVYMGIYKSLCVHQQILDTFSIPSSLNTPLKPFSHILFNVLLLTYIQVKCFQVISKIIMNCSNADCSKLREWDF